MDMWGFSYPLDNDAAEVVADIYNRTIRWYLGIKLFRFSLAPIGTRAPGT